MTMLIVDGYSVIHAWPELQKILRRNLASARERLVQLLTSYQDSSGHHVVVVFDGIHRPYGDSKDPNLAGVEVLFSQQGQTADAVIEQIVSAGKGKVDLRVVTNDHAERLTVESFGAYVMSVENFISELSCEQKELSSQIRKVNKDAKRAGM